MMAEITKNAGGISPAGIFTSQVDRSLGPASRLRLEAVPQRKLHTVVGRRVVGVPRLHGLVECVYTLSQWAVGRHASRQQVSGLGQQRSCAADWTAGVVLIGEVLPAPSLVEKVQEVDDVESELQVLLPERLERLTDAHIHIVLPWVAAGVAAEESAAT